MAESWREDVSVHQVSFDPPPPPRPPSRPAVELKPYAALVILAILCAIVAIFSDAHLAWALVSAAAAGGALTAHRRGARWPWEVHLLLARVRLAAAGPAPERSGLPSTVGSQVHGPPDQCTPVIAFRRLSIVELFTAAGRVLTRYWPALVGIPVAILATFVLVFVPILSAVMGALFSASTDTSGGVVTSTITDPAPTLNTLLVAYAVMLLVCILVAFPADALLLGASVIATQHAVRGASITLSGLWSATRSRLPAICRMTAVFYALALSPELILLSLLVLTGGIISPETVAAVNVIAVFVALATFVFGIFLSLAPIILLAEQRSVTDALRRSMTLARAGFPRLLGLHLMWVAIVLPLMLFSYAIGFSIVLYAALIGVLIAVFRVFQVLIYTDLRLRYEDFGAELEREVNERASHLNPPRESRRTPEAGAAPRGEDVAAPEETVNDVPRTTSIRETARRSFAGFRDRATSRNEISAVDDVPPDIELSRRQRLVVTLSVIGGVLLVTFAGTVTSLIQRGPAVTEVDPAGRSPGVVGFRG